jgi:GntR family transcriptional regulator, transcriptional repressor for pyruvate dehydrogenase complex
VRSFEDIIAQVRDAVAEGRLRPGERLPSERALAETFGVSRATLREALRSLEALGVVEIRRGASGGAFAAAPDEQLLGDALATLLAFRGATARDLAEFRVAFEADNARWAVRNATAEDRAAFARLAGEAAEASSAEPPDWQVIGTVDMRWHEAVARATHNPIRIGIMLGIHTAMRRAFASVAEALVRCRGEVREDIESFARAVEAGDAEAAVAIVERHVERWNARTSPAVAV